MNLKTLVDFGKFCFAALSYAFYLLFYGLTCVLNCILMGITYRSPISDKTSARIGRILWKQKLSVFHMASTMDFICLYLSRADMEYVLKPNISLYCVTKDEATFVETDPNINVYSSDENPFFFTAQFTRSEYVIKLPIASFHSLAERIGNPSIPVLWLSNTGRCGSTILCQVFESVPNTLVMAEPDVLWNIFFLKQSGSATEKDYTYILRSTVRLLCKPQPGIERIFIKPRAPCLALMTDISAVFPTIKQLFMYRNFQETIFSWIAALKALPYTNVLRICANNEALFVVSLPARYMIRHHFICTLREIQEVPLNTNTIGLFTHMWANQILVARDAIKCDQNIRPIKYETMLADPMETCKELFKTAEIDFKHLDVAVTAFKQDSQRGSILSRDKIRNNYRRKMSKGDRITADTVLTSYKLPRLGENIVLRV